MYEAESEFAGLMADAAEKEILKYFRCPLDIEDKADTSPVTQADKNSERIMRDLLKERFPDHGIVGEEYGKENENAEFVWVLDPIDGTKSFIAGVPLFGTLIALLHNGRPVVGVINQPYTKERWIGVSGKRTTLNDKEIHTRSCPALNRAVLFSTADETMFNREDKRRFEDLCARTKIARFSTDCYGYGLLAAGSGDVVCEADLKLYDYAALVPVVTGAGGVMTDWDGNDLFDNADLGGHVLALGDKHLLTETIEALHK
ncbi:MAG: histidinol-phosphatase [Alphaproteobacteria bacterium]|nr:histidinol-phosphatase [Alphaproteobacteria bacterium]